MIALSQKVLQNEGILYLIFGGLTTFVYLITRLLLAILSLDASVSATIANILSILFAFITNDTIVFRQIRQGWLCRLGKFIISRLATALIDIAFAYLLVAHYPHFIGYFVNDNEHLINLIEIFFSQTFVILLNYILSKVFVFKNLAH
ncbi:GtrA family protein [Streptococcus sciuri]